MSTLTTLEDIAAKFAAMNSRQVRKSLQDVGVTHHPEIVKEAVRYSAAQNRWHLTFQLFEGLEAANADRGAILHGAWHLRLQCEDAAVMLLLYWLHTQLIDAGLGSPLKGGSWI